MFPIKKDDNILDFGAGTGFLTIPAAKMVDGLVYALDLDPHMLEIINTKVQEANISNVKTVQGNIDYLPLPDNSMDLALASLVLHEINPLSKTLKHIKNVLKENGYFMCIEFEKKDTPTGDSPRISSSAMEQELIDVGFSITEKLFPTESLYVIIAKK